MTRPSPCAIELSDADRALLRKRSRDYTARYADVVRAKIVLLSADGQPNTAIAARLDVHVDTVRRWRNRFFESGLGGLADRAHPKRTTSVPAETVVQGQLDLDRVRPSRAADHVRTPLQHHPRRAASTGRLDQQLPGRGRGRARPGRARQSPTTRRALSIISRASAGPPFAVKRPDWARTTRRSVSC
jgi:transposase-like protein